MPATIIGMREISEQLAQLPRELEAKFGLQGLRDGAVMVRKRLMDELPKSGVDVVTIRGRDGSARTVKKLHLRELVGIRRLESVRRAARRGGALGVRIGYSGIARTYGHIIEFGNSEISPRPVWRRVLRELERDIAPRVARKIVKDVLKKARGRARK